MHKEEHYEVLDEAGNPTGVIKSASEIHRDELWHHGAHVWVLNSANELLMQRRSKNSFHSPGLLDPSTTGHVEAGEDVIAAARREVNEELGIELPAEAFLFLHRFAHSIPVRGGFHNEFNDVYLVLKDIDLAMLSLEASEVGEVMYVPYEALKRGVLDGTLPVLARPEGYAKLFESLDAFLTARSRDPLHVVRRAF